MTASNPDTRLSQSQEGAAYLAVGILMFVAGFVAAEAYGFYYGKHLVLFGWVPVGFGVIYLVNDFEGGDSND